MSDLKSFDPTRVLDGWRVPAPPAIDLALKLDALRPDAAADAKVPAPLERVRPEVPAPIDAAHVLDGWQAPAPAPLDLDLKSVLRAGSTRPDDAKKAWLKARGYEMLDVEDVEVSERPPARRLVELAEPALPDDMEVAEDPPLPLAAETQVLEDVQAEPAAPPEPEPMAPPEPPPAQAEVDTPVLDLQVSAPPPPADPQQVIDEVRLPEVAPPPAVVEAPVLDFQLPPATVEPDPQQLLDDIELPKVAPPAVVEAPVLDLPPAAPPVVRDPRLLACWQPLAWTALAHRLRDATTEVVQTPRGPLVQTHPPQWLCALWQPQSIDAPLLGRWPELAGVVGADTALDAFQQLLDELPPRAHVWLAELEADWALVAELVLQQDDDLSAGDAKSLRELIAAERSASEARVTGRYAARGRIVRRRA